MNDENNKHYTNIKKIIKNDLHAAFSNPIVVLALIAIIFIPSLYALLNIAACWDVYGNTEAIDFAIINNDNGTTVNGQSVNIGNDVVKELKNNTKFNWQFVSEADGREGVKNGTYAAGIVIPSDFSKDLVSITSDDPVDAEFEYLVNEKTSPMTSRMGDSAVKEIQRTVNGKIIQKIDVGAIGAIESIKPTLSSGVSQLSAGASQVSAGASQVSAGASKINTGSSAVSDGASQISKGSSAVSDGAKVISTSADELEKSVNVSQIPDEKLRYVVSSSLALAKGSSQLASSSSELADGSNTLAASSVLLATSASALASGSNQLASGSNKLAGSSAMALIKISNALSKVNAADNDTLNDFFYSPVKVDRHEFFSVPQYGTEVAPFYIVLSIWVGCLITCVMLKLIYLRPKYTPLEMYFGKLALFIFLGLCQATVTIIGTFLLGVNVVNVGMFIFSMYLISVVFMIIVYSIISVFGNIGKAIVVILLVLQISGTGGVYPIQLMAPFFQTLYPFMPMTYAITMMRESVLGLLWCNYIPALEILLVMGVGVLILATLIKEKYDKRASYFEKCLEDSGLF